MFGIKPALVGALPSNLFQRVHKKGLRKSDGVSGAEGEDVRGEKGESTGIVPTTE